ncbi:hypothetical protein GCM10020218_027640 [Dactylosporangium vinaceum]
MDKLVAGKDPIPDGLTLAWEAIAAVVGRGQFVAPCAQALHRADR